MAIASRVVLIYSGGEMTVSLWGNSFGVIKAPATPTGSYNNTQKQPLKFKEELKADTFNGKSLVSSGLTTDADLLTALISFLGRKNNHKRNHSEDYQSGNSRWNDTRKDKTKRQKRDSKRIKSNSDESSKRSVSKEKTVDRQPRQSNNDWVRPVYEYKNIFDQRLKAEINPDLKSQLRNDRSVYNLTKAVNRVTSLSTYLKEYMVGFVTPDGDHWFEKTLPYIYKGCVARDIPEQKYLEVAKDFWGLLAKADNYWKSDDFLNYLGSMAKTPAVQATIEAVKSLQLPKQSDVAFGGYPSKIKYIPDLNYCAYSGRSLEWDTNRWHNPSAEHIFPHSIIGEAGDIDINYFVVSAQANSDRGNIPLLAFLKGHNEVDYDR